MAHDVDGIGISCRATVSRCGWTSCSHDSPRGLADGDLHGAAEQVNSSGVDLAEANLSGALSGNSFEFVVAWPNGSEGQYTGNFDAGGNLSGVTFDIAHPTSQATWFRQVPQF